MFLANDGELLSQLFMRCGIDAPHPCAGRGICQKCKAHVDGKEILTCEYRVTSDVTVSLGRGAEINVSWLSDIEKHREDDLFYALDLGTTTLALALVSYSGEIVCRANAYNPQSVFGGDVISRIAYCTAHGAASLQAPLIKRINEMTAAIGQRVGHMLVAGNTTMLHLFFGVDCSSMGASPYTPAFLGEKESNASSLGISGAEKVTALPSAHAFVGADVMAGLGCCDMPREGKFSLLADLGTNAEIVLFSRDKILCTAAAAGPCFEGASISCGMGALDGAICSFSLNGGLPKAVTVGNVPPKGICATGLIDIAHSLLEAGIIDESGYMEDDYLISEGVCLTPRDVRELQLAKSAVCSAIEALIADEGITLDDIDTLYITGGFAEKLSCRKAAGFGLIPPALEGACRNISNACLSGIIKYVCEEIPLGGYAEGAIYRDLTLSEVFNSRFMENMSFYTED